MIATFQTHIRDEGRLLILGDEIAIHDRVGVLGHPGVLLGEIRVDTGPAVESPTETLGDATVQ